jgi:hypothetical protein
VAFLLTAIIHHCISRDVFKQIESYQQPIFLLAVSLNNGSNWKKETFSSKLILIVKSFDPR